MTVHYVFIGQHTGKEYARGHKIDCLRKLNERYPSSTKYEQVSGPPKLKSVYPEPLRIVKEVR